MGLDAHSKPRLHGLNMLGAYLTDCLKPRCNVLEGRLLGGIVGDEDSVCPARMVRVFRLEVQVVSNFTELQNHIGKQYIEGTRNQ